MLYAQRGSSIILPTTSSCAAARRRTSASVGDASSLLRRRRGSMSIGRRLLPVASTSSAAAAADDEHRFSFCVQQHHVFESGRVVLLVYRGWDCTGRLDVSDLLLARTLKDMCVLVYHKEATGLSVRNMEHLTPAELLRFLEEEANTLQLMNAKIADQLHCLQVEEEFFSRQLSDLDRANERSSVVLFGSGQRNEGVNVDTDDEDNFQNKILSEGFEPHSTAPDGSSDQALNSKPKLQESPKTRNSSGTGGQEPSEATELERDHDMAEDLQGQQQEQEVLNLKEPSLPHRTAGRRPSRRPARLQD